MLGNCGRVLRADSGSRAVRATTAVKGRVSHVRGCMDDVDGVEHVRSARPRCGLVSLRPLMSSLCSDTGVVYAGGKGRLVLRGSVSILRLSLSDTFVSRMYGGLVSGTIQCTQALMAVSFALRSGNLLLSMSSSKGNFSGSDLRGTTGPCFAKRDGRSRRFKLKLCVYGLLYRRRGNCLRVQGAIGKTGMSTCFGSPAL